ncbi:DUF5977 domain-containing protein [Chryseobacterium fistulae]|uniref:DUF5977 domain-containing protein n=1 Tax=Chryseobacterium fistulae TaxID=2675058 RepID=A0A6N4XQQ1_9FLAO|nr:DUF5977 domain-containing protein [Chryseobacterium fistulae]CAA7386955.1 hypothetical protein CHRY9393_01256 [Chryseobacterium fistulae]
MIKNLALVVFLFSINITAQITRPFANNALFLSPEVSAFQKYNLHDINLYTGKINLSIPIYEIKTGNIIVPITISYNSGGIKIDNIASSVGMGWNLSAGGSVIRTIKDIEDHSIVNSMGHGGSKLTELGSLASPTDIISSSNTNPVFTQSAKIDASPDVFTAVGPGIHTRFYLSNLNRGNPHDFQNNVSTHTMNFIDGSAIKGEPVTRKRLTDVLPSNGFTSSEVFGIFENVSLPWGTFPMDYEKFEFTNTQGLKYSFGSPDVYEYVPNYTTQVDLLGMADGFDAIAAIKNNITLIKAMAMGQYKERVSAWNLNTIEDPTSNRSVLFQYQKYNKPDIMQTRTSVNTVLMEDAMPFAGGNYNYSRSNICGYGFISDYMTQRSGITLPDECMLKNSFLYTKYSQTNRIESIQWENGNIKFYYDLNRQDAQNEKALTKIEVMVNDKIVHTYFFNYSYFNSKENCNEWQCKRLKLDNIDIMGAEETQAKRYYSFEYDYTHPLPKVNSLQQDFLGYYNNHGVELPAIDMHIHPQIQKSPTLYFRKQSGINSITPFSGGKVIPGDYSLESNQYSLTGLLKKVINPLGGFSEFEYENHDFYSDDIGVRQAGGARIKTQILNDGQKERYIYYEYKEKNGMTSGKLAGMPVYGFPLAYDDGRWRDSNNVSFITYSSNKGNIELTDNSYIGYTRVTVKEEGNGYKEHVFSYTPNENPVWTDKHPADRCGIFLHLNSSFGATNFIDKEIVRGKILEENTFNEQGALIKESKYRYKNDVFKEINIPYQNTIYHPYGGGFYPLSNDMDMLKYLPNTTTFKYNNTLKIERNVLVEKIDKEYVENNMVETQNKMTYDHIYPFVKSNQVIFSDTSSVENNFTYPYEVDNQLLLNANMVSTPLITENKLTKNGSSKIVSKKEIVYGKNVNTSNLILPTSTIHYNLDNTKYTDINFDKYDSKGNLLQYTSKDGVSNVVIWGYKQSLPLVQIGGVTYKEVMQKFGLDPDNNQSYLQLDIVKKSDLDFNDLSKDNLKSSLHTFRNTMNLPDSQISTFTHNPGIGVSNIAKPNNMKEDYKYKNDNKLSQIIGHDEKLVKEYQYNNVPQHTQAIFYNRKKEQIFTRSNCPVGHLGGDYTYRVTAGSFSSPVSVANADQMALHDIQLNGQNKANILGTCTAMACSFVPPSSLHQVTALVQKISHTKVKVKINIPITANTTINWQLGEGNLGNLIGTIGDVCKLQTMGHSFGASENGRSWKVLLAGNGAVYINLENGIINSSDTINLDFEYDVNDQNTP